MSKELFGLGERIKHLREAKDLTQAELARILGLSRSAVNAWEMGLSVPSVSYIVALSKLFGVSSDMLLGINSAPSIRVDSLTDRQVAAIVGLIECFNEN